MIWTLFFKSQKDVCKENEHEMKQFKNSDFFLENAELRKFITELKINSSIGLGK